MFSSCQNEHTRTDVPLFTLLKSESTGVDFSNDLPVQLELNIFNYMYYYNGGGLGVADLNQDGLIDLVFSSNLGPEKVYINKGDMQFQDVSDIVKVDGGSNSWTNGVAIADINGDGLNDIYLSQVGEYRQINCSNKLFVCTGMDENGIPKYKEESARYGLDFKGFSTQAGFFDYDLDGDLDMFLMNHSLHHNGTFGKRTDFLNTYDEISGDRLYRNDGSKFTNVTKASGINSSVIGYGLGLAFGDVNNDGWPDIYVGNDFHENDYLYINQGDGTFSDELTKQIKHTSRFSMGVDIADINNDGYQDIISLDMLPEDPVILKSSEGEDALDIFNFKLGYGYNHQYARNALQLNQGNNTFKEIGAYAGIHATDWSWSSLIFDMDMDGMKDIFISNGIPKRMNDIDYIDFISGHDLQYKIQFDEIERKDMSALEKIPEIKLHNKFYQGQSDLRFNDLKNRVGNNQLSYSNSSAYADLDNDGDYDLVCNNIDQASFIYENKSAASTSVKLELKGSGKNTHAIGSRIIASYADREETHSYFTTKGFQSSMINQVLLPRKDLIEVTCVFPDKRFQVIKYEGEDLLFDQSKASGTFIFKKAQPQPLFEDITEQVQTNYVHKENSMVEFNREPLIPFSTSSEGPAIAVHDFNKDGYDDIYVGSAKRKRHKLLVQNEEGFFEGSQLPGMVDDSIYEEVDALFLDFDRNSATDLFVATAGNEYRLNSPYSTPLMYTNDRGNLEREDMILNDVHVMASCITAVDYNGDDLMDLFLGGRVVPRSYGAIPASILLKNKGGYEGYEDVTSEVFGDPKSLGFVRDAQWVDVNRGQMDDLVVATEWGPIVVYLNLDNEGSFERKQISEHNGWWTSVLAEDFDQDGDVDIFAGNLGLNSRLKASVEEPIRMYYNDFDDNGVYEQILTYYVDGRELPFSNKMELQKQLPGLKKKFLYAKDFAKASIEELFGAEKIKSAAVFTAEDFENSYFENDGEGNFTKVSLPIDVQYTSYNTAEAIDVNGDGFKDIVLGGNFHYCNVQMGRYDADNGSVLINKSGQGFEFRNMINSPIKGQVRRIKELKIGEKNRAIVFAQNSDTLKVLKILNNSVDEKE